MTFSYDFKTTAPERRDNLIAFGIIFGYCVAYAAIRLLISSSMELSEAEQFLDASFFSFGYGQQAPLYSWIVKAVTLVFGMNIVTLIAVKYSLLCLFYFFFYLIARDFWDMKTSLLLTGSLLLLPTFSYEVHRDLTHTILVSLMAAITYYLYLRMVREIRTMYYALIGISVGLGILSKYNFLFFLAALSLAGLSLKEGRRVIFDKRVLFSILCALIILLPHIIWLTRDNFTSVHYALARSRAGESSELPVLKIISIVFFSYLGALIFSSICLVFFRRYFSMNENRGNHMMSMHRLLAFYGLVIPLLVIFFLHAGNFTSRWLVPVFFSLPLAVFSFISVDMRKVEFRVFGYLCMSIAVVVLTVRAFIGFFPDTAGKVERIHVPYKLLSRQLVLKLEESGIAGSDKFAVICDADNKYDRCIAANIMAWIPTAEYVPLRNFTLDNSVRENVLGRGGVFVCHSIGHWTTIAKRFSSSFSFDLHVVKLTAPYLHSSKHLPCVLKVVIIPKKEA
jgi:4-amino-4-deoxy-L-arabinose transferase-like glycosyltransferase